MLSWWTGLAVGLPLSPRVHRRWNSFVYVNKSITENIKARITLHTKSRAIERVQESRRRSPILARRHQAWDAVEAWDTDGGAAALELASSLSILCVAAAASITPCFAMYIMNFFACEQRASTTRQ